MQDMVLQEHGFLFLVSSYEFRSCVNDHFSTLAGSEGAAATVS